MTEDNAAGAEKIALEPEVEVKLSFWDRMPWRRRARELQELRDITKRHDELLTKVVRALTNHTQVARDHGAGWIDAAARLGAIEMLLAHSGKKKRQILQNLYKRILADLQEKAAAGQSNPEQVKAAIEAHLAQGNAAAVEGEEDGEAANG